MTWKYKKWKHYSHTKIHTNAHIHENCLLLVKADTIHSVVLWRLWLLVVSEVPTKGQGHLCIELFWTAKKDQQRFGKHSRLQCELTRRRSCKRRNIHTVQISRYQWKDGTCYHRYFGNHYHWPVWPLWVGPCLFSQGIWINARKYKINTHRKSVGTNAHRFVINTQPHSRKFPPNRIRS